MKTPEPPTHIGQKSKRKYQDGRPMNYEIEEEIIHRPKNRSTCAFYLQQLKFTRGRETYRDIRLCYYVVGHKGRTKGKWVFGQFAPMMQKAHFEKLIREARKRGWIKV